MIEKEPLDPVPLPRPLDALEGNVMHTTQGGRTSSGEPVDQGAGTAPVVAIQLHAGTVEVAVVKEPAQSA